MSRCKVVVVGPAEAGKSTLIRLLTERAMNVAVRGRTVAMDHGLLWRNGEMVTVVGVPGQPRFAPVREVLSQRARGAIWVHPAGQAPDQPTVELLNNDCRAVPYLVVVNQRDGEAGREAFQTPNGLRLPSHVIAGDLVTDVGLVETIKRAIWSWIPA